jgi:hypothetical protein
MDSFLIGTLETASEFDALAKLQPGEPYFLLLGRDRLAPKLVQQWADDNRRRALDEHDAGQINDEKLDRELRKSTQAEAKGWDMKSFKAGDMARKLADEPTVKTYSGVEVPEETKRTDRIFNLRIALAAALSQAASCGQELTDFLGDPAALEGETDYFGKSLAEIFSRTQRLVEEMGSVSTLVNPTRLYG